MKYLALIYLMLGMCMSFAQSAESVNSYQAELPPIVSTRMLTIDGNDYFRVANWDTLRKQMKGDKGEKGETGAQGIQGIQGLKGDKGDIGNTGATGSQGIQGVKGDKGDAGATGAQGIQGIQGVAGTNGVAPVYSKTALLSNTGVIIADTFSVSSASPTVSFASILSTTGKTNFKILSATGYRAGATATNAPQVAITALSSNSATFAITQQNTATVTLLGINVLSGLPMILVPDPVNVKLIISLIAY